MSVSKAARVPGRNPLRAASNIVRLVWALASEPAKDDVAKAFPKMLFQTPGSGNKTPDGQSLAYLRLARALWLRRWETDVDGLNPRSAAFRVVHDAVQQARVLERELLEFVSPRQL